MNDITIVEFNYKELDGATFDALMDQENALEMVLKRSHKDIGEILLKIKHILPYGMYGNWCTSKGISKNFGWRCVQIALGKEVRSSNIELLPELDHLSVDEIGQSLIESFEELVEEEPPAPIIPSVVAPQGIQSPAQPSYKEEQTLPYKNGGNHRQQSYDTGKTDTQLQDEARERIAKRMAYARRHGTETFVPASKEGVMIGNFAIGNRQLEAVGYVPNENLPALVNALLVYIDTLKEGQS